MNNKSRDSKEKKTPKANTEPRRQTKTKKKKSLLLSGSRNQIWDVRLRIHPSVPIMYKKTQRHIDRVHLLKHLPVLREFQKDLGVTHLAATMLVAQVGHSEESSDLLHHRFVGVASIELENVF